MTTDTNRAHSGPRYTAGSDTVAFVRQTWAGLRVLLVLTVVLGFAYPLAVTGVAQLAFPWQANGSLVTSSGDRVDSADNEAVGSVLIGQGFDHGRIEARCCRHYADAKPILDQGDHLRRGYLPGRTRPYSFRR